MYAVIEQSGKQYRVQEGDTVRMERLHAEVDSLIEAEKVLMVMGPEVRKIGTPLVEDAIVRLKVTEHGKGKKLTIFKYKPKTGYRRKQGHRQPYTDVVVEAIEVK